MPIAAQLGGLVFLLLLACPISMGAMMWFMSKGAMSRHKGDDSLADLKAEQSRLAEKIASFDEKPEHETRASETPKVA